jgi:hypothetical protein
VKKARRQAAAWGDFWYNSSFLKKGTAGFSEGGAEAAFQPGTFSGTIYLKNRLTFEISRLKLRSLAG